MVESSVSTHFWGINGEIPTANKRGSGLCDATGQNFRYFSRFSAYNTLQEDKGSSTALARHTIASLDSRENTRGTSTRRPPVAMTPLVG